MSDIQLTDVERQILFNQQQIMRKLEIISEDEFQHASFILEHGIESEYWTVLPVTTYEKIPRQTSDEVMKIFDLYSATYQSCERNGMDWKKHPFKFLGFDHHEEGGHFTIAPYFMKRPAWCHLNESTEQSAGSVLARYRQLLDRWHEIGDKREMTKEELEHLFRPFEEQ